jgi:hypothetical protein
MSNFLVGNTAAKSLLVDSEASAIRAAAKQGTTTTTRLLFIGVGDVRNALLTLSTISPKPLPNCVHSVELFLNDLSPVTLARDVVLLALATQDDATLSIEAATSVWSDAVLTPTVHSRLTKTLTDLVNGSVPSWMFVGDQPSIQFFQYNALVTIWKGWLELDLSRDGLLDVRAAALSIEGAGHGRAGASVSWRQYGLSSVECTEDHDAAFHCRTEINPTMLEVLPSPDGSGRNVITYLETQGTMGAFGDLEGLDTGSAEFAKGLKQKCWGPLFTCLRSWVAKDRLHVHFWLGDCMVRLASLQVLEAAQESAQQQGGAEVVTALAFDAVDTSNVMDYVGMWNLLVVCVPRLKSSASGGGAGGARAAAGEAGGKADEFVSFVQTESIISMGTCLEELLEDELPHDPSMHRELLALLGWAVEEVAPVVTAEDAKSEKVVRAKWFRSVSSFSTGAGAHTGVGAPWGGSGKDEQISTLLCHFFSLIASPTPMSAAMLEGGVKATMELAYPFPKLTAASFVSFLCLLQRRQQQHQQHQQQQQKQQTNGSVHVFSVRNFIVQMFRREDLCTSPHIRNRLLGLRVELGLAVKRGCLSIDADGAGMGGAAEERAEKEAKQAKRASKEEELERKRRLRAEQNLPDLLFSSNELRDWFMTTTVTMTLDDPTAPRGGVFEPALAAVLVRDEVLGFTQTAHASPCTLCTHM